jgi:hypothetical protein
MSYKHMQPAAAPSPDNMPPCHYFLAAAAHDTDFASNWLRASEFATPQSATNPPFYVPRYLQVLEGLDPVRKRPGMYIGSTGPRGLHQLLWEVLDNSIDEVQAGAASRILVEVDASSGWVTVTDNGRWVLGA